MICICQTANKSIKIDNSKHDSIGFATKITSISHQPPAGSANAQSTKLSFFETPCMLGSNYEEVNLYIYVRWVSCCVGVWWSFLVNTGVHSWEGGRFRGLRAVLPNKTNCADWQIRTRVPLQCKVWSLGASECVVVTSLSWAHMKANREVYFLHAVTECIKKAKRSSEWWLTIWIVKHKQGESERSF